MNTTVIISGIGFIAVGLYMAYPPLAFVFAGLSLLAIGYDLETKHINAADEKEKENYATR